MTLQNAQQKVRKAHKSYSFAQEMFAKGTISNPPLNYVMIAYNNCQHKLSFSDFLKFDEWYNKFVEKNKV
jgi:hypothetical protein